MSDSRYFVTLEQFLKFLTITLTFFWIRETMSVFRTDFLYSETFVGVAFPSSYPQSEIKTTRPLASDQYFEIHKLSL